MPTTRSHDFKYIPADAFTVSVNDNGVKVSLGIEEKEGETTELIGVHMSHRSALLLCNALLSVLNQYQAATGKTIEVPDTPAPVVSSRADKH